MLKDGHRQQSLEMILRNSGNGENIRVCMGIFRPFVLGAASDTMHTEKFVDDRKIFGVTNLFD